jgi:hypothetical protein
MCCSGTDNTGTRLFSLLFPRGNSHAVPVRTSNGTQYADLSSLTPHVVHWELRRSWNWVLYPIASTRGQNEPPSLFHNPHTVRAHDCMRMAACLAGTDDRVNTRVEDRYSAWQNPESVSKREKEPCDEEKDMHLVVVLEESRVLKRRSEKHLRTLAFWSNIKYLYTPWRG